MLFLLLSTAIGVTPPAPPPTPTFAKPVMDSATLRGTTARADVSQVASARQSAQVSGNSVSGQSVTGSLSIDGNAFQNQSGLTIVNANTGNNVAVNAAMNVNISFAPPPQP